MGKKMDLNGLKPNQKCFCSSSGSIASATSSSSRSSNGIPDKQGLRTVHLRRQCGMYLETNGKQGDKLVPNVKPNNFGFSFRGGREFGTGFFVSVVEKDSEAQYKGLKVGDQIIRINGLPVDDATHHEVLQLAQSHHQLTLTVKSLGIIPVKDKSDDPITWKVVDSVVDATQSQMTNVGYDVDRVLIEIPENTQLGCGICKGPDWRPGIFIQYTKPNSLARRCGLQPGDQILQCNRTSFLQIDFTYAVSVLKNSRTLDLVLKKGSGIDLFPGESSGYSSSSSVADEAVNVSPSRPKRLSIVAEEGDDKNNNRKSCQCISPGTSLKIANSIDSIFDNVSNDVSNFREKSKSTEILTDSNAVKKTVTFKNNENVSRTFLNLSKPRESRHCIVGSQTVIKIESNDTVKPDKVPSMSIEKKLGDGLVSLEVHRTNGQEKVPIEKSPSLSSFSSSCSLSSAISEEIQRRKERRLKGNTNKPEKNEIMKPVNRQQRHQHDLLIAELKKKQGWDDKSNVSTQTEQQTTEQLKNCHRVPEPPFEKLKNHSDSKTRTVGCKPYLLPLHIKDAPPACPTPDYFSDTSLTDQSIDTSHTVKSSILKFEEKNRPHKTVTFGQNSTKEITPLKSLIKAAKFPERDSFIMTDKKSQDRVEMQSIESFDLTEPKQVAPKPPPVYFPQPLKNDVTDGRPAEMKKKTTIIKITEYPTDKRREPAKFDFINRNLDNNGFDSELASTLSRSNLKNKIDAFANLSNGSVIKNGNDKPTNGVITSRYNGLHSIPAVIPTGVTESQISSVKKALKTFERNTGNTVVLKLPK